MVMEQLMKYFKISLLLLIILLAGCAKPQRITVSAKPVEKPVLILPDADVLYLKPVSWFVLTPENVTAAFESLNEQGQPSVFFGITDQGYENIAINFSDIRAYIQQLHAINTAYKRYYIASEKIIDTANSQINEANKQVEKVNDEIIDKPAWYQTLFKKTDDKGE